MRPDAFRTGWRALACVLLAAGPLAVAAPPADAPVPREGLAARIQACADVAYAEGQVAQRDEWEAAGVPRDAFGWLPTVEDLDDARARLRTLG